MQEKQTSDEPKRVKYKRPRAQRACKTCHERKVKCNLQETFPEKCTNCVQFNISECVVPEIKKRTRNPIHFRKINTTFKQIQKTTFQSDIGVTQQSQVLPPQSSSLAKATISNTAAVESTTADDDFPFLNVIRLVPEKVLPKVRAQTICDFVCSTTSSDIMRNTADEFITNIIESKHIDRVPVSKFDLNVLKYAGAFNLPEESLCWIYINEYFEILHPLSPVLSKAAFMRDYKDLTNPPSILLLQTVIFSGAKHHDNPNWSAEERERHEEVVMILFRRAKALYDADIEIEPIPLCQTFSIFSWSCEGKLFTSRTTVHWIKLGVFSVQAFRMDKNQESSKALSYLEKKLYKRIFWSLFVKDRFVAMVFAQSFSIDLNKCTVPPLTMNDLSDDEPGLPSPYQSNLLDKQYFLEKLKFVELLDIVVENQSSSKRDVNYCSSLLSNWYKQIPERLSYRINDKQTHSIMSASLAILYYTLLIALHRTELVGRKVFQDNQGQKNSSWSIMFKSGHMIACIVDSLGHEGILSQIISCCVTHAASQFLLHVFNANPRVSTIANQDILICLKFLNESKRSSILGAFACSILNEIYTDKSKLVGLLLRVLSPDEFKELSQLNEGQDTQQPNKISQSFNTSALAYHSVSQNTIPIHQSSHLRHTQQSLPGHNLRSPDCYVMSDSSSLSPQNIYGAPPRHDAPPQHIMKSPIDQSDTSRSPNQQRYTQPPQATNPSDSSGVKTESFDPEKLFREELEVGLSQQISNTIPRFVAASISNSETNGSSTFSPAEGQPSEGLDSLGTSDTHDPTWVLSEINTYWVPKFELPNQDPNIQQITSSYVYPESVKNSSNEYLKNKQQLQNYQKTLASQAFSNGDGIMQPGVVPEFVPSSFTRDTNTLNNQWDLFNFF